MASRTDRLISRIAVILIFNAIALGFGIGAGILQIKKVNGSSAEECHARGGFVVLWLVSLLGLVVGVAAFGKIACSFHKDATAEVKGNAAVICFYISILIVLIVALWLLIAGIDVGTKRSSGSSADDAIGMGGDNNNNNGSLLCVISHPYFIFIGGVGGSLLNVALVYLYFVYLG